MEKGLRKNKWEVGAVVLGAKKKKKTTKTFKSNLGCPDEEKGVRSFKSQLRFYA